MPDENKQKYEAKLLKALYHICICFQWLYIYHTLEIISRHKCYPGSLFWITGIAYFICSWLHYYI